MDKPRRVFPFHFIPAHVTQILCLPSGESFPVCPACRITLEHEYQAYCDRCGQRLDWKRFNDAQIIYPNYQVHF